MSATLPLWACLIVGPLACQLQTCTPPKGAEEQPKPGQEPAKGRPKRDGEDHMAKVAKSDEEWRKLLTPEQYAVTRLGQTERAFTGKYWNFKGEGVYRCVCCGAELFRSDTKFDSGCGWPAYWAPLAEGRVQTKLDTSEGMVRTEVTCARCGAHLGHVFDDGPKPTGLRYCINSAALKFEERKPK